MTDHLVAIIAIWVAALSTVLQMAQAAWNRFGDKGESRLDERFTNNSKQCDERHQRVEERFQRGEEKFGRIEEKFDHIMEVVGKTQIDVAEIKGTLAQRRHQG